MSSYNVAVVGATGVVGEAMLSILEQRNFPIDELYPLASERSAGTKVMFRNKPVRCKILLNSISKRHTLDYFPLAAVFPPNMLLRLEIKAVL